jgi:oxygen-dependent protoporphyrinogen oxidase
MLGGAVDPSIGALDDADAVALAVREVSQLYSLTAAPVFTHAVRIARAIPQYEIGHGARVAVVASAFAPLDGIAMTGFGLRGISFGDAAADGVRSGDLIARALSRSV